MLESEVREIAGNLRDFITNQTVKKEKINEIESKVNIIYDQFVQNNEVPYYLTQDSASISNYIRKGEIDTSLTVKSLSGGGEEGGGGEAGGGERRRRGEGERGGGREEVYTCGR